MGLLEPIAGSSGFTLIALVVPIVLPNRWLILSLTA